MAVSAETAPSAQPTAETIGTAKLSFNGTEIELPVVQGTEGEVAIDIRKLRGETGWVTLDDGFGNTGSCLSAITFIDGEKSILRHRGYAIEDLATQSSFAEVCYLVIYGHLPNKEELSTWRTSLVHNSFIHEDMLKFYEGFPLDAHPMSIMTSMVASLHAYHPDVEREECLDINISRLIGKVKTIAAFAYKKTIGQPVVYPKMQLSYAANFLRMMFATPAEEYEAPKEMEEALNMLLILHADHEQNCSTSTARMVGSSLSNLYASTAAAIAGLWGSRHGGANQKVIEMLQMIAEDGGGYKKFIEKAKDKDDDFRLMGFGHRVYRNYDPRAQVIKTKCDELLTRIGMHDPLLDIAKQLEEAALSDDYFAERKLYPNVDFYSGIIYRAMGIPLNMFTVMFALGRMPGWVAQWKEMREEPGGRIHRPRQIYIGENLRDYVPLDKR